MNSTLAPLLRKFVSVFFDVYSRTYEEHVQHIKIVFELLAKDSWKIKMSKCSFAQRRRGHLPGILPHSSERMLLEAPHAAMPPAIPPAKETSRAVVSSPIRGSGTPPRAGPRRRLLWESEKKLNPRGDPRRRHVSSSDSWRDWIDSEELINPDPLEEGGAIEEFFGQLWLVPTTQATHLDSRSRVSHSSDPNRDLVWIPRDLWESKGFSPEDCNPIGYNDSWKKSPLKLKFAKEIWGEGKRKSFVQALKSMAGRGRGGRGPRPRADGNWDGWGEGLHYPPPMPYPPPPSYYQPVPPYGFFPNPPSHQGMHPPPPRDLKISISSSREQDREGNFKGGEEGLRTSSSRESKVRKRLRRVLCLRLMGVLA
jgi:hypothetical protein